MKRTLLAISMVLVALAAVISILSLHDVQAEGEEYGCYNSFEYWLPVATIGDVEVYASNWFGQTFSTAHSHTLDTVALSLYKEGTPGDLTISLYRADVSTNSTIGEALASATFDGDTLTAAPVTHWISFDTPYVLDADSEYALVFSGTGVDANNNIHIEYRGPHICANFVYWGSINNGYSWASNVSRCFEFVNYGYTTLDIFEPLVFRDYIQEDDWLIVFKYYNIAEPYYVQDNPKRDYLLQYCCNFSGSETCQPTWGCEDDDIWHIVSLLASALVGAIAFLVVKMIVGGL